MFEIRMFEIWKEDVRQRRVVLKLMGIMPAATAFPSVTEARR
jgi:hypothetical protein